MNKKWTPTLLTTGKSNLNNSIIQNINEMNEHSPNRSECYRGTTEKEQGNCYRKVSQIKWNLS